MTDFVDYDMSDVFVCEVGDGFNLAFEKKSFVKGEMVLYYNQDPHGNVMRVYNLGRPVKGHKPMIFDIPSQNFTEGDVAESGNILSGENLVSKQTIQTEK